MNLFHFDESELNANRNGRLSDKQKARLAAGEKSQKGCSAILGIFLFLVASIGIVILYFGWDSAAPKDRTGLAIFGFIWPLVWGMIGFFIFRRSFAKMEVKIKKAEGSVKIVKAIRESYNSSSKTTSEYSVYELRVGKRVFEVKSEVADIVTEGDVYAVYYADINIEDSEDPILSVELLARAK
jgi:hypothetical protein